MLTSMDQNHGFNPNGAGRSGEMKRRRIPKACTLCRKSKVRCDGGKPCRRCRSSNILCEYIIALRDPVKDKLESLELQLRELSNRTAQAQPDTSTAVALLQLQQQQSKQAKQHSSGSLLSPLPFHQGNEFQQHVGIPALESSMSSQGGNQAYPFSPGEKIDLEDRYVQHPSRRSVFENTMERRRGDFITQSEASEDIVSRGLVSHEEAFCYFERFFQGCDKYVPVFDPKFDTYESVKVRSGMLFDTICTIGCRAEHGPISPQFQSLSNATKSPICDVILGTISPSIETIQSLLINASYYEKGWLLTSLALRMAIELELPESYTQLCSSILLGESNTSDETELCEAERFRRARVWFGTFILEHILSIDCGKKPGVAATDGIRRCRVLVDHPSCLPLDLRLLSQVELNSIRALAHERLMPRRIEPFSDQELSIILQGTRMDLSIWLSDWTKLVETHVPVTERASLIVNMRIQRDWAEMTMLCKGLQCIGIENVAIMTEEQQKLVFLINESAQRHLSIIISNPELYLGTFRYGMDFVWAKCAFSVLLLLKLARLIPSLANMPALISDAKTLLSYLSKACGSNNIYHRILGLSVEKCERALKEDGAGRTNFAEAEMDFQNYVPKEFILEWNFPGLTFCWIPLDFQDMFLDFGTGC